MTEGIVKYFYHSPLSRFPIPDVTGAKNDKGTPKTEYHAFLGKGLIGENWIKKCQQKNIQRLRDDALAYLFWITTCQKKDCKRFFGEQYIVGFLEPKEFILRPTIKEGEKKGTHLSVIGEGHIFAFEDSIPTKELFGKKFDRPRLLHKPYVQESKVEDILIHFSDKKNILERCISEIERIDTERKSCFNCGYTGCIRK